MVLQSPSVEGTELEQPWLTPSFSTIRKTKRFPGQVRSRFCPIQKTVKKMSKTSAGSCTLFPEQVSSCTSSATISRSSFQMSKMIKPLLPENVIFGGGTQKAEITLRWQLNTAVQASPSSRRNESSWSHLYWKQAAEQHCLYKCHTKIWGPHGCAETYLFTGKRQALCIFYQLLSQHSIYRCLNIHPLTTPPTQRNAAAQAALESGQLQHLCKRHKQWGGKKKTTRNWLNCAPLALYLEIRHFKVDWEPWKRTI